MFFSEFAFSEFSTHSVIDMVFYMVFNLEIIENNNDNHRYLKSKLKYFFTAVDVNAQNPGTLWTPLHAATFQEHGPVSSRLYLQIAVVM